MKAHLYLNKSGPTGAWKSSTKLELIFRLFELDIKMPKEPNLNLGKNFIDVKGLVYIRSESGLVLCKSTVRGLGKLTLN